MANRNNFPQAEHSRTRAFLFVLCLHVFFNMQIFAQSPGSLDNTFDSDGKVTTDFFGAGDNGYAVAQQADGKIVVAGNAYNGGTGTNYFALTRYNSDGSLDNTFDTDGKVLTSYTGYTANEFSAVLIQSADQKIIAVGSVFSTNNCLIARYNPDGSLDNTFDSDGKILGIVIGRIYSATMQSDGKIVAAGSTGGNFKLARFNTDGSSDNTFDTDGIVNTDFGVSDATYSVIVQADGKIVAGGLANSNAALARYNTDGSLDNTFDTDGKLISFAGVGRAVVQQSDGKLILVGFNASDFVVARYNTNGSLDNTFDTDGIVTTDFGATDEAHSVILQTDGKIIVKGAAGLNYAIARYNTNGSLDNTFDTDGKVVTDFGSNDYSNPGQSSITLQADGKIIITGSSRVGAQYDIAVARYWSGTELPIELLSFTGYNKGNYNVLNWSTATESNNDYFSLEKSVDGLSFNSFSTIKGAGNSSTQLNYTNTDEGPYDLTYYRLKQTDYDGKFAYSDIISISMKEGPELISIYPNPAENSIEYIVTSYEDALASLIVYDGLGKKVFSQTVFFKKGHGSHSLDVSQLSAGCYVLNIETAWGLYKTQREFMVK